MKINHRIAGRSDNPFWHAVERLGVRVDRGDAGETIWVLNVSEDDPAWPEVVRLISEHKLPTQINNLFSAGEIAAAQWLQVSALGHHGYPQPEDDYIMTTYTNSCPNCGIGGVQTAPFRLRAEPKASRSQFIQLNWVFDELFLRSAAAEGLAAASITGIEYLAPILHKRNQPSKQVVQMNVATVLPPALDPAGLAPVTCKPNNEESRSAGRLIKAHPYCGRVKYHAGQRGPLRFNRKAFAGAVDVVKSHEWFGSGAGAFRLIIVSQRFRQVVTDNKWQGLTFEPIELIGPPAGSVGLKQARG